MKKTSTYAYCDNPGCENSIEIAEPKLTPAGWYAVVQADEKQQLRATSSAFIVCSLDCLAEWALERDSGLRELEAA